MIACMHLIRGARDPATATHRLLDGVDPEIIATAEATATTVPGVAHARARWTGRTEMRSYTWTARAA
jgi:hypothetical protein